MGQFCSSIQDICIQALLRSDSKYTFIIHYVCSYPNNNVLLVLVNCKMKKRKFNRSVWIRYISNGFKTIPLTSNKWFYSNDIMAARNPVGPGDRISATKVVVRLQELFPLIKSNLRSARPCGRWQRLRCSSFATFILTLFTVMLYETLIMMLVPFKLRFS